MIVVDSSALFALLTLEASAPRLASHVADARRTFISAATVTEIGIVVLRKLGSPGLDELKGLCVDMRLETIALDERQAAIAIDAYRHYGRGSGSAAKLNFGDCFSYALAKALDLPLLYIGDDFVHTDVKSALAQS